MLYLKYDNCYKYMYFTVCNKFLNFDFDINNFFKYTICLYF